MVNHQAESKIALIPENDEQQLADDIVKTLLHAEKPGKELKKRLSRHLSTYGLRESLARRVLDGLERAIKSGAAMHTAMKEAAEKSTTIAKEFVKEHPVLAAIIVTLIALGVLAMLAPSILEALGFGELGPVAGQLCIRVCNNTSSRINRVVRIVVAS